MAPAVEAVHGSVRQGQVTLSGGYLLSWQSRLAFAPLPRIRTDMTLQGPDTRVSGGVHSGLGGIDLDTASGRAGPGLAQWVPGAWTCDMTATIDDIGFFWGWRSTGGSGAITTPAGTCTKGSRTIEMPALALNLSAVGRDALFTLRDAQATTLATVTVRRARTLDIAIAPEAADVFPQLPRGGPIRLQLPF